MSDGDYPENANFPLSEVDEREFLELNSSLDNVEDDENELVESLEEAEVVEVDGSTPAEEPAVSETAEEDTDAKIQLKQSLFLDPNDQELCDKWRRAYADLLLSMGFLNKSSEVRKTVYNHVPGEEDESSCYIVVRCHKCHNPIRGGYCKACHQRDQGDNCVICEKP